MGVAIYHNIKILIRLIPCMVVFFTISQVEAMLPDVVKKFEMAIAKKNHTIKLQAEAERAASGPLDVYINARQRLNEAVVEYYTAIKVLEETGAVIKGLDQGLLDFASKRFNEEVWLCWKYGEKGIGFWHEKDSGFTGRKPLAVDDKTLV